MWSRRRSLSSDALLTSTSTPAMVYAILTLRVYYYKPACRCSDKWKIKPNFAVCALILYIIVDRNRVGVL